MEPEKSKLIKEKLSQFLLNSKDILIKIYGYKVDAENLSCGIEIEFILSEGSTFQDITKIYNPLNEIVNFATKNP